MLTDTETATAPTENRPKPSTPPQAQTAHTEPQNAPQSHAEGTQIRHRARQGHRAGADTY